MKNQKQYDVIVLGAGAAGLMCALTAGNRGKRVLVLEVSNKAGKKILMSGGGRCNFTNLYITHENFLCTNPHFVKSALSQYSQWDFIAMVNAAKIAYHEKSQGQLFCDKSAKLILEMLLSHCAEAAVDLRLKVETQAISQGETGSGFSVQTAEGEFACDSVVVASGGLSIPTLGGATGLGYRLAEQFGLTVLPTSAALVPFTLSGRWQDFAESLAGVSIMVDVSAAGKMFSDSLLFTHRGLSGPAILQLSNYWDVGAQISINLLPEVDLYQVLLDKKSTAPKTLVSAVLHNYLPRSLSLALCSEFLPNAAGVERAVQDCRNEELSHFSRHLHNWLIKPSGTEGYRTAEVTRAGVSVDQISSKTMQVKGVPGLFFIGEVLDVTGHLGGYNFQWAWSSGFVAGQNV